MTLVFIPGAGCTSRVFAQQRFAFGSVLTPDLPGHAAPGSAFTISDFTDYVERYVGTAGLTDIVLCGHSMGGAIALECALRHNPCVRGLVLFDSGARLRVNPKILTQLAEDFSTGSRELAALFFARGNERYAEVALEMFRAVGAAQTIADFQACDAFDVRERLSEIDVPLLAIVGEEDRLTPPASAQFLADRVPSGQARRIAGAGHFSMLERPREVNELVNEFVIRCVA